MGYLTAPRAHGVWCTQCGEPYALEPDNCAKCGCQGFTLKEPEKLPPVTNDKSGHQSERANGRTLREYRP
jgi:hypothetical protein